MSKRKKLNEKLIEFGKIIQVQREYSYNKKSRLNFINSVVDKGILEEGWISEKSLSNIENGYNLPNLVTLKKISIALEMDFLELIKLLENYI